MFGGIKSSDPFSTTNLLLDVGPESNGSMQREQVDVLRRLGRWAHTHRESLYGTVAGMPHGHVYGASTLNKGRDVLYVTLFDRPIDAVAIKGIRNNVKRATVLGGDGSPLAHRRLGGAPWAHLPGVLWVDVPQAALDPDATVLMVELESPLDLYTGAGDVVTFNH